MNGDFLFFINKPGTLRSKGHLLLGEAKQITYITTNTSVEQKPLVHPGEE